MKVALVHDWLIHMRGGEKVLESLAELYPNATIYTLFYHPQKLSPSLQRMKIVPSFLQYLPGIKKYYRYLLPLLPFVIKTLRIRSADLVISSSHCVAKGITIPKGAVHLCYCHTPMRYLWGFEKEYFPSMPALIRPFFALLKAWLRSFDLQSNASVNQFIANSQNVQKRISEYYQRTSTVVYPPLDLSLYHPGTLDPENYYLAVSAFVPYKRVDLVIEAFNHYEKSLRIVGSGPMEKSYRNMKKSSNITFLGAVSNDELKKLYAGARALIFPTEEDFGIVPLEAQACGTPVIAYGKGGALESVQHGIFFEEQTAASIRSAVEKFELIPIDRGKISNAVTRFGKDRFKNEIRTIVSKFIAEP